MYGQEVVKDQIKFLDESFLLVVIQLTESCNIQFKQYFFSKSVQIPVSFGYGFEKGSTFHFTELTKSSLASIEVLFIN